MRGNNKDYANPPGGIDPGGSPLCFFRAVHWPLMVEKPVNFSGMVFLWTKAELPDCGKMHV